MDNETQPSAAEELVTLIRARYPVIYVVSWEEERVEECLARFAQKWGKRLVCWSLVKGLHKSCDSLNPKASGFCSGSEDPQVALDKVMEETKPTVYLFKDLTEVLDHPLIVRRLKEVAQTIKASPKTLVLVSNKLNIPPGLEKDVVVVRFDLPSMEDIGELFDAVVDEVAPKMGSIPDAFTREQFLLAAKGLTLREAESAFARTLIVRGQLTLDEVPLVLEEKKQIIRKSEILEYIDVSSGLDSVGGLANLKEWVRKRSVAFSQEARSFGLPAPKGVLLLGVQGCGKSLSARAIAQQWHLPLLRLDVGRVFTEYMGNSEENIRAALRMAESVAPAILWVDEIEKSLSGMKGGSTGDGGTSMRVFATFLTWLQEKKAPVFVIATANRLDSLPPELLRKGRLDEIFFVDLPTSQERYAVFQIHLARRGRNPRGFDLDRLVKASEGFSGSEIEEAVVAALYDAFDLGRDIRTEDIEAVLKQQVPLSITMREDIAYCRQWAKTRARPASA